MRRGILFISLCMALTAMAQKDGGISKKMLGDIQKEQKLSASDRALVNAIASNNIDELTKNYQNSGAFDTHFSVETKKQSITDQKQSGR